MSSSDASAVKDVLLAYQDALNKSSTPDVMRLYDQDGIFMPQHFPRPLVPQPSSRPTLASSLPSSSPSGSVLRR